MRLLRLGEPGDERPCVLDPDGVVRDVSGEVTDWRQNALDPDRLAGIGRLLNRDPEWFPAAADQGARRAAPIPQGAQIFCAGLNYHDHARDAGLDVPVEPIVYGKPSSTIVGPGDDIVVPPGSTRTDWEVELGVVIGRRAQYLPDPDSAWSHIAGYCTVNDLAERHWLLERGGQWTKGKSFESFNPTGPYLVTPDEIPDPQSLRVTFDVNGKRMQDGTTADMIFGVAYLVWYFSQFAVLEPGDLINTGTPGGVALGRPDEPFLRPGDEVTAEVAGLGAQHQRCRSAQRSPVSLTASTT